MSRHVYAEGSKINRCVFCGGSPEHLDHKPCDPADEACGYCAECNPPAEIALAADEAGSGGSKERFEAWALREWPKGEVKWVTLDGCDPFPEVHVGGTVLVIDCEWSAFQAASTPAPIDVEKLAEAIATALRDGGDGGSIYGDGLDAPVASRLAAIAARVAIERMK